ncbi:MAG: SDR family oxidoreductase [Microbacteriaceae bacterium]|nr:SDR family oxidoreductase [Microbacteriaceae bacterium]
MTEPQSFEAQHVLITGAGSGIGRLMALGATQRGAAHVVLWDRDLSAAQSVVQEISALGGAASAYKVDISQRAAVMKTASTVLEKIGHLDVLINNAGIVIGKKFLELDESDVTSTYAVNTLALYWTTAAFLRGMLERDTGRVVTIASAAGLAGSSKLTDYSGSKFAAAGFMESLRAELRDMASSVSCLTVYPFYINTGMFDGVKSGSPLLAIQNQETATARILDAIESTKRELLLPGMVYSVRIFRLLPAVVFDWIADAFGINKAMKTFRGRRTTT